MSNPQRINMFSIIACSFLLLVETGRAEVRLQAIATADAAKAEAVASSLNRLGAGPAIIQNVNGISKVLTKAYASVAEANFAKPALRGSGYLDVFAVVTEDARGSGEVFGEVPSIVTDATFDQMKNDFILAKPLRSGDKITTTQELLDDNVIPELVLYEKCMAYWKKSHAGAAIESLQTFISRFPDSQEVAKIKLMRAYWLMELSNLHGARQQLVAVTTEHSTQVESGEAELRLGYLQIRDRAYAEALRTFHGLASGNLPSAPEVRVEAMLRTAALFHRGKDGDKADQCYAAIEQVIAHPDAKAFAAMQRTGLALERAWSGKGTLQQARKLGETMLMNFPGAPKSVRATASLMVIETMCYQKEFQAVVNMEPSVMDEVRGTREACLAYYWLAKARFETGDTTGSLAILAPLISANLPSEERFQLVRVTPQAQKLAARAYERLGYGGESDGDADGI